MHSVELTDLCFVLRKLEKNNSPSCPANIQLQQLSFETMPTSAPCVLKIQNTTIVFNSHMLLLSNGGEWT